MGRAPARDSGLTIVEMLVVLAILAMAMAAAPTVMAGLNGNRLRAAAIELMARLREAHAQATRTERPAELILDLARRGSILSTDGLFRPWPSVIDSVAVVPASLITGGTTPVAHIVFHRDGSATAARLVLRHGDLSSTIVVDRVTGRVWRDE